MDRWSPMVLKLASGISTRQPGNPATRQPSSNPATRQRPATRHPGNSGNPATRQPGNPEEFLRLGKFARLPGCQMARFRRIARLPGWKSSPGCQVAQCRQVARKDRQVKCQVTFHWPEKRSPELFKQVEKNTLETLARQLFEPCFKYSS